MMRKATVADIGRIMTIIERTIKEMSAYGNTQWDVNYPQEGDFLRDIESGDLYVSESDRVITGVVCVNRTEPEEYKDLGWRWTREAMVVHRMAVHPDFRRNGIGTELLLFAEILAFSEGVRYLKTDTYEVNEKMNALFKKCGYCLVGEMRFPSKEKAFFCYDKMLPEEFEDGECLGAGMHNCKKLTY